MDYEDIRNIIVHIIVDKFGVEEIFTADASYFNDLGLDSLDAVELMMEIEKEFNISITDEEFRLFNEKSTIKDSIDFIYNKLNIPILNEQKIKVKCINQGNFVNITVGKEYDVMIDNENTWSIISNNGLQQHYYKKYFEIVEQHDNMVIPEKIIYEYQNKSLLDFSISNHIKVTLDDGFFDLQRDLISDNCGIIHIWGINDLFMEINEDIDLFEKIIKEIIAYYEDSDGAAAIVFSTNDEYYEIWKVLDNLMSFSSETMENPNTENQIKLWMKYINQD